MFEVVFVLESASEVIAVIDRKVDERNWYTYKQQEVLTFYV